MTQLPLVSPMEENRKSLDSLIKKIDAVEIVTDILSAVFFSIGGFSGLLLVIPLKIFGIPIYSITIFTHSFLLLCLFIVYYYLFPPLINERYRISCEIGKTTQYQPAYHRSKNEMFWAYQKMLLSILTNTGIWVYLTHTDIQGLTENNSESGNGIIVLCFCWGILLFSVSLYGMGHTSCFYDEPNRKEWEKKCKTENAKKDINKTISPSQVGKVLNDLNGKEVEETNKFGKGMVEKVEEIRRLKKENLDIIAKYDAFLEKLEPSKKYDKS